MPHNRSASVQSKPPHAQHRTFSSNHLRQPRPIATAIVDAIQTMSDGENFESTYTQEAPADFNELSQTTIDTLCHIIESVLSGNSPGFEEPQDTSPADVGQLGQPIEFFDIIIEQPLDTDNFEDIELFEFNPPIDTTDDAYQIPAASDDECNLCFVVLQHPGQEHRCPATQDDEGTYV